MKPQLAQRGAVQILRPSKLPFYEEAKKPPLPIPMPKLQNQVCRPLRNQLNLDKNVNKSMDKKSYLLLQHHSPIITTPKKAEPMMLARALSAHGEQLGKENRDKDNPRNDGGNKIYNMYVRKHYNVPVVKLQGNAGAKGKQRVVLLDRCRC